jgi:hypothetical protein
MVYGPLWYYLVTDRNGPEYISGVDAVPEGQCCNYVAQHLGSSKGFDCSSKRAPVIKVKYCIPQSPCYLGRAIAQAVIRRLPTRRPGLESCSSHVVFSVDEVALG